MSGYEDIIDLPHHQSKTRPHMSNHDRAAQFAPFAALTGHGAAITEAGRLTAERIFPDESVKEEIDAQLRHLNDRLADKPEAEFTYFIPDRRKDGGEYIVKNGRVAEIDTILHLVVLDDGETIPMEDLLKIDMTASL